MSNLQNRCNCVALSLIASIAVGIIGAVLLFTAVITVLPVIYWVIAGIAVGFLALAFFISAFTPDCNKACLRQVLTTFIIGVLGTILTALILLGVGFAATSVIGAIVFGAAVFFFSLLITSVVCAIKCFID